MPLFPDIDALQSYVDTNITANGVEAITGPINNSALNGCIEFIRKSPLNWSKAIVENTGGDIVLSDDYLGVAIFSSVTPDSLSFGDNIYNEYVLINMTPAAIPLDTPTFYYNLLGQAISEIPANTAITLFKATNDIWVLGDNLGTSSGIAQKEPKTYKVGVTTGAPVAGTNTWQLPAFLNSYVILVMDRSTVVDMEDTGDGSAYITKVLASDTLSISNWTWVDQQVLTFILITP